MSEHVNRLTVIEYLVLREISQTGTCSVKEIAEQTKLVEQYVWDSVTGLLDFQYLAYSQNAKDKVYPTDLGRIALVDIRVAIGITRL